MSYPTAAHPIPSAGITPRARSGAAAPARTLSAAARLRCDRRGVAVLELAFIGPVFLFITLLLFEMCFDFFAQQALDFATEEATRQIQIGAAQPLAPTAASFGTAVLCPYLSGLISCSQVMVNVTAVSDFMTTASFQVPTTAAAQKGGTPTVNQQGFAYCNGQPLQLMLVHTVYMAPVWLLSFFPSSALVSYGGNTVLPIVSTAAFVTEDFPVSTSTTSTCQTAGQTS